jgi:hypothetical protein
VTLPVADRVSRGSQEPGHPNVCWPGRVSGGVYE